MDTNPPSFEPRKRRPRPSAEGARIVGKRPNTPLRQSAFANANEPDRPSRSQRTREPAARAATGNPPRFEPRTQTRTPASHEPAAAPARPQPRQTSTAPRPGSSPQVRPSEPESRMTRKHALIAIALIPLVVIASVVGWVGYLYSVGNSNLTTVDALSDAEGTPGSTYLIVGSDEREPGAESTVEGNRADTIMLLHVPRSGPSALVSIPRDTLVTYPDGSMGKINASLQYGGQSGLVTTVETLTGLVVDHYVQIGMSGVENLTDAVGGVELCLDYDVDDPQSGLLWKAGCHLADGETALAFSRMRYSDPLGDIGRTARQRQVVSAIIDKAVSKSTLTSPGRQTELVTAASSVLTVGEGDSLMDIAQAGLAMRSVLGHDGLMGTPPIADLNYTYNGASHVLLDPALADQFWSDLREGELTKDSFASF